MAAEVVALAVVVLAVGAGQARAATVSFTDPGCSTWTVPDGVTSVDITATGGAGQDGTRVITGTHFASGAGGAGSVVTGTLSGLVSGSSLEVCVDQGSGGSGVDADGGGGGAGGGASSVAIQDGPTVLVAGGGGGGGDGGSNGADQSGGDAGLPSGTAGEDAIAQPGALGGGGGSQVAAGAGGSGDSTCASYCGGGHDATLGTGGFGGQIITITGGGGGGGGGGYYGGGGGGSGQTPCTNCGHAGGAGGGGGSDYCAGSLPTVTLSGCAATGSNSSFTTYSVVFTYSGGPAAHTLTVSKSGTGSGSVSSSPAGISCGSTCSASFAEGAQVTLTGSPSAGSVFAGWSGGGCSGTGTCTVTLAGDTAVTAAFNPAPVTHTLTVSKSGSGAGSVTSSPAGISCGATCSASYLEGSAVTLSAGAAAGSAFAGWSGGGCSGTGTCTVTLGADRAVTAAFNAKCRVPNVKGKALALAKLAITSAHCAVGKVAQAFSATVKTGKVISQNPASGASLAAGSKVTLVVSKGVKPKKKH